MQMLSLKYRIESEVLAKTSSIKAAGSNELFALSGKCGKEIIVNWVRIN